MPQTREAIDHAKAANVPIVVAINKIDKPGANPDNVKRELAELNLVPEDWGGSTVMVQVSAKKRQNLDQLLEMILLSTDILELRANPKRSASGTVLEAKLDRGRGPVATVLVQDGTLNVGDNFIAGPVVGKVRALIDDRGRPVRSAGPSTPVEVLGLASLPQPGDPFQTVADAAKARQIATFRQAQAKERSLGAKGGRLTLESLKEQIAEGGMKELPIIVKADVQGSAEVVADTLSKLTDEKVKVRIRCRRDQRVGRTARVRVQRDHHRLQRPSRPQRPGHGGARRDRHPSALGDLQRHRGDAEEHGRAP
jgi:translation initiation factor IF-2